MQNDNKISEEVATEQINNLLDYYGIVKEDIEIEDGVEAVQTMFNTLIRAIRRGNLEITEDEDGIVVTHHLSRHIGETSIITYRDRIGRAKIAMDSMSSKKPNARMNQFMSTMGDIPASVIINLKGFDSTICSRLATVFSMV